MCLINAPRVRSKSRNKGGNAPAMEAAFGKGLVKVACLRTDE